MDISGAPQEKAGMFAFLIFLPLPNTPMLFSSIPPFLEKHVNVIYRSKKSNNLNTIVICISSSILEI